MATAATQRLHVMAGALRDSAGRVLLAQRPAGKHLAGFWEFPGGKREIGESPQQALARELHEELGIQIDAVGAPLIRVPWDHGERGLLLDAWQLSAWHGVPQPLEGQALQWIDPMHVDPSLLAPADRAILQALRLPDIYPITPADSAPKDADLWHARVLEALKKGVRLVQLRLPLWEALEVRALAARLQPAFVEHGAHLLLNADIDGARALGDGIGVHLRASQMAELIERPLPWTQLVGASCHDPAELSRAVQLNTDFATLSPLALTESHPLSLPLGWPQFAEWTEAAALPVYALGGVSPAQRFEVRQAGGQGVAGIGAFW